MIVTKPCNPKPKQSNSVPKPNHTTIVHRRSGTRVDVVLGAVMSIVNQSIQALKYEDGFEKNKKK